MQAQEFGSPGEHMASVSNDVVSGGVAFRNPNKHNYDYDNNAIIGEAPIYYSSINKDYDDYYDRSFVSSARSMVNKFNDYYFNKNLEAFNLAKEYDMYMSNSAIQRQVEDLKKAGLNPILATHLGGASYHGVNAPYMSISPSSALGAYLNYDSSMYSSNLQSVTNKEVANIHTKSNELINQFQECNKLLMQGRLFEHENEVIELKKNADEYLESLKHLNDVDLQKFGFENQKDLYSFKNSLEIDLWNIKNYGIDDPGLTGVKIINIVDKIARIVPFSSGILHN